MDFGPIEQIAPRESLRPDHDADLAVVDYGSPDRDDLPVFVDFRVLADVDGHARSDTSVELGGILLGERCIDPGARHFVHVTAALVAKHYESSRGSFKFTHDTWSEVTRERHAKYPDLQIVGWYHTHPGWGVFLSGMDDFICRHFFNHPLDIAYVIDPCQNERGMFFWQGEQRLRPRKASGFFITAAKERADEMAQFISVLNEKEAA
jgi:proteasome lid subunit RPN8/RPN11